MVEQFLSFWLFWGPLSAGKPPNKRDKNLLPRQTDFKGNKSAFVGLLDFKGSPPFQIHLSGLANKVNLCLATKNVFPPSLMSIASGSERKTEKLGPYVPKSGRATRLGHT